MSTLKICTHDRTQWITNIYSIILQESFDVKHFDDPIRDCCAPDTTIRGNDARATIVVDFQEPNVENEVVGDTIGNVLLVWLIGEGNFMHRVVAPARSCFLMSDSGKTIDRI